MPIATNDKGDTIFLDSDGAWKPATLAEHPETKQRLAFDGTDWKPLSPKTTTGEAVGRGITQGASFGFRDEGQGLIEAGGGGGENASRDALTNLGYLARGAYRKLTGDPEAEARYKAAVERERASTKQIEQERPGAYLGGNVLGAVTMPVGFAARAPTFASRLIAGAKTGAAAGALTGFGEGEGLEGSLKGAAIGAPVGGLVGGAAVPVTEGLVRGAGALASYPVNVGRGLLTPGAASERAVGRALQQAERSDPTGANRITQAQFQAGPGNAVVGDVLGEPGRKLARSAANISPEARETMNLALNARGEAQGARAISWLDNQFSFPNARAQQEALQATARSANNAAYQAAERQGMQGIQLSPSLMESDTVLSAMQTAAKKFKDEQIRSGSHYAAMNPRVQFDNTGALTFTRKPDGTPLYPDLRFWDLTRRELSSAEQQARRAGNDTEVRRLGFFANRMNEELDAHVPAYRVARRTAAGFFDARDALEAGQNFATQRFANDGARTALATMNQTERALFRDGYISRMKDVLGATKDNRDITKMLGASAEDRAKMVIAMGPQRAREFQAMLHAESIMQKLKEAVQGNSTTVMQLLGAGAAGAAGGGYLGFDPTTSGITGALTAGLKKGADANMARHITRLMMSRDPAVLQAGIRQIARNARNLEILQRVSNAVARAAAQQTVDRLPRMQYGGRPTGPTVVGEDGPEVFVPDVPGTVVPADEAQAAREAAAARTGHRGRREGAGTQFVEGGYGIPAAYRALDEGAKKAFESAGSLQHYGDEFYDPAPVVAQALGAVGAPMVGPAMKGAVLGSGAIKPIRAYHGSPYDFERFDLSKIGTGEGAQAYGHGLYFAENPATAQSYRDALKDINNAQTVLKTKYRDVVLDKSNDAGERLLAGVMRDANGDASRAATILDAYAARSPQDAAIQKALELAKNPGGAFEFRPGPSYNAGRMYEVNINAAPEHFLDWDKPLAQQAIAETVAGRVPRDLRKSFDANVASGITGANAYHNYIPSQSFAIREPGGVYGASGAKTFEEALALVGGDPQRVRTVLNPSKSGASEALREAGIPGIKYLDQGSRFNAAAGEQIRGALKVWEGKLAENPNNKMAQQQVGDLRQKIADYERGGTSNYVLFRDDIIDIVKKYGLAGAAAMYGISQDEARAAMGRSAPKE